MEAVQKTVELQISPSPWCEAAARVLASSIKRAPCFSVEDYRLQLERDANARLYRVDAAGILVGFVMLRIQHFAGGAEGEILAAAGRLPGVNLTLELLPALERMFTGVSWLRISTARPGLVAKLERAGWIQTHTTLRKAVTC